MSVPELPKPFKNVYDWGKFIGLLFAVGVGLGSFWVGKDRGFFIGVVSAAVPPVLYLAVVFTTLGSATIKQAEELLSTSDYKPLETRQPLVKRLRRLRRLRFWSAIALTGVTLVLLLMVFWPSASWWISHRKPSQLSFSSLHFLGPADAQLLKSAPFLEAVHASLRQEGDDGAKDTEVFVGTTAPFSHPAPEFRLRLSVQHPADYEISGYGFRQIRSPTRALYEAIPASYRAESGIVFTLPSCDESDRLLILCRLSLLKSRSFPADLSKEITSEVLSGD